jgi:hypothetical protein
VIGNVELLIILLLALVYLAIPIITLVIAIQINNRLSKIEQSIGQIQKSE